MEKQESKDIAESGDIMTLTDSEEKSDVDETHEEE